MNSAKTTKSQIIRDRFQSIYLTLNTLHHTLQTYDRYQEKILKPHNLTPSQFGVIYELYQGQNQPHPLLLGTLAEKLSITQGTLTGLIKRLETKGLVQRIPQAHDRRQIALALTSAGETIAQRLTTLYFAQQREDLKAIDPAELDLLRVLLHKLDQTLRSALRS